MLDHCTCGGHAMCVVVGTGVRSLNMKTFVQESVVTGSLLLHSLSAVLTQTRPSDVGLNHITLTHAEWTHAQLNHPDVAHISLTHAGLTHIGLTHAGLTHGGCMKKRWLLSRLKERHGVARRRCDTTRHCQHTRNVAVTCQG